MIIQSASSLSDETSQPAGADRPLLADEANRDMFLRLLVAQIRSQDPLSPQDPTEFVAQLAQFSALEQLLEMRKSLNAIESSLAAAEPLAGSPEEAEGGSGVPL